MRLAELIATFSVAADAGMGLPMDHGLRTAAVAVRVGEVAGASEAECSDAYYLALLRYAGCTADSDLAADVMEDEVDVRGKLYGVDWGAPSEFLFGVARAVGATTGMAGAARFARTLAKLPKLLDTARSHCEVGDQLGQDLGFSSEFRVALFQSFERWDGRGWPNKLNAEAIALPMRIVHVAEEIEFGHRRGGSDAAMTLLGRRARGAVDPRLVECVRAQPATACAPLEALSSWQACLDAEPAPVRVVSDAQCDSVLRAIGDFSDLKSRFTRGHARGVASHSRAAAARLGLGAALECTIERAGYVHDVGRVAVSASVWDKPTPLNDAEWERVRAHSYVGERILARAAALAELAEVAMLAHERLDGTGYHRKLRAASCSAPGRVLAAADVYQALTETRPYRAARDPDAAGKELQAMARAGVLCPDAVHALLAVSGLPAPGLREQVSGLTEREVEVLRLVARGLTNKEIGNALQISTKTVSRHLEHIFDKLEVTTRAGAAMFAMRKGLVS